MKIAIIGGGAGGLACGSFLSSSGIGCTIFDGNEKVGKKLFITGKGRCNLTNACENEEFLANVVNGKKFLISAVNRFGSHDLMTYLGQLGLKLKVERGNRVFPQSDKSSDVINALKSSCSLCDFKLNEPVTKIVKMDNEFLIITERNKYTFDYVIVASGGLSYPATGSTGNGYKFAKDFGHNIVRPVPALVPIRLSDVWIKDVQGLSLKNVTLKAKIDNKTISQFGEMLFTGDGISGPIALTLSSYINRSKQIILFIDFKPALTQEQVENRILRDFETNKNKNISYIIKGLLPGSLIDPFLDRCQIEKEKKVNSITKAEREKIVFNLKNFNLQYNGLYPIDAGIVTSGGVDLKEVNPKTMESKIVTGVFFIGEVLDIDCLTGGFNLQSAFSTAYSCAEAFKTKEV